MHRRDVSKSRTAGARIFETSLPAFTSVRLILPVAKQILGQLNPLITE
jgi:hypothetical protein